MGKAKPRTWSRKPIDQRPEVIAFKAAVDASGISADQLENFLRAGYIPQPKQMKFHAACREADRRDGPEKIGFGGARGGGKTAASFAQVALDDCQREPGLKVLFLRKVSKAAKESVEDLRRKHLRRTPHTWRSQAGMIEFKNESRIFVGHFAHEKDIDSYLGLEYDEIAIEEDTQLSGQKKSDILTCLRTSKPYWRPRSIHTTNPGGIDHIGFKRDFITPWRNQKQTLTRFIPSTIYDNRAVDADYQKKLERLTGWQRDAWLLGDWDIAAGQYFSTWNYEVHTEASFPIPKHWPIWASLDYGFTHPTAVLFYTENEGQTYVINEHCESGLLPRSHAEVIHYKLGQMNRTIDDLEAFNAGADCFANKGDENAKTIAEQYEKFGIFLGRAPMDRVSGWTEILNMMGDSRRKIPSRLHIFRDKCPRLVETLPALQHNPNRVEDVLKWDADDQGRGGDDAADCLRYGVMSRIIEEMDLPAVGSRRESL